MLARTLFTAAALVAVAHGGQHTRGAASSKRTSGKRAHGGGAAAPSVAPPRHRVPVAGQLPQDHATALTVDGPRADQVVNRPSLIDYNPVASAGATVVSSDGLARFTVLTDRVIRMEQSRSAGAFEDHATIAMMNRALPVPAFTSGEAGGVLTISTAQVRLTYTVGQPFAANTLSVVSLNSSSGFSSWSYGDANPGNLLGTIRGLDGQNNTPLNCTQNSGILDNGEFNHCEWGMVSRSGWVVYDDSANYILDANDWWVPIPQPAPSPRTCDAGSANTDVDMSSRSSAYPNGATANSGAACCDLCMNAPDCIAWVYQPSVGNCWPLSGWSGAHGGATDRTFGIVSNVTSGSQQNADAVDAYGFFHGLDYFGAIADFVSISGKTIMVPRYASGIWWSRWYDFNNADVLQVVDTYASRRIPMDVQVLDMNWHTKDNWSGFTFDAHLFPYPADTMGYLKALGLPVTLNIHDASGVNSWEALFPQLVAYLGLPASSTVVPFNLVNATVAYAVEDIVLGDLIYNKGVAFWWTDWQQGGTAGGMTGFKQNPTMWLNHLRATDRHRNGDTTRAMSLARWGGLGGHRYQVGFSGDVQQLTWGNLAYQPYFSATAANVGHGFWSHDIEGPGNDAEMFTRWIQAGAFSGIMRNHDRGMSAGSCANDSPFDCSVVEPWNAPNTNFPAVFEEANAMALQFRGALLPYVYNGHRAAFDSGVGLIRPMYYHFPQLDAAYAMDGNGNGVQYMFGPSILFSPVVTPGSTSQLAKGAGMAQKNTWLPPGTWVDANSGVVTTVAPSDVTHNVTKAYALQEVPLWYAAGSVIPYVPLRSLPTSIGNAARQYSSLGFRIVNGGDAGEVSVYEDDGATTAYLTDNAFAWTTAAYAYSGTASVKITISTSGSFPELLATRAYQIHLLNSGPVASVTANGVAVPYNRYGRVASAGRTPASNQHFWECSPQPWGMGAVIDVVGASTAQPLTIQVTFAAPSLPQATVSGVYGPIMHALWAKGNMDEDRSTPGSNTDDPAYTSVLSSVGGALEYLAGANVTGFVAAVRSVPGLLASAVAEISQLNDPRQAYALALLQSAAL